MNPTQSSWGMTMIVNDLADAMDRLVERASGDLAAPTVAGRASPRARSGLGHTATINYRNREADNDRTE